MRSLQNGEVPAVSCDCNYRQDGSCKSCPVGDCSVCAPSSKAPTLAPVPSSNDSSKQIAIAFGVGLGMIMMVVLCWPKRTHDDFGNRRRPSGEDDATNMSYFLLLGACLLTFRFVWSKISQDTCI
jgi:hypothetical protein